MTEEEIRGRLGLLGRLEALVKGRLMWAERVTTLGLNSQEAISSMDRGTGRTTNTIIEALQYVIWNADVPENVLYVIFPTEYIASRAWKQFLEYSEKLGVNVSGRCYFVSEELAERRQIRELSGYEDSKWNYIEDHYI